MTRRTDEEFRALLLLGRQRLRSEEPHGTVALERIARTAGVDPFRQRRGIATLVAEGLVTEVAPDQFRLVVPIPAEAGRVPVPLAFVDGMERIHGEELRALLLALSEPVRLWSVPEMAEAAGCGTYRMRRALRALAQERWLTEPTPGLYRVARYEEMSNGRECRAAGPEPDPRPPDQESAGEYVEREES